MLHDENVDCPFNPKKAGLFEVLVRPGGGGGIMPPLKGNTRFWYGVMN